MLAKLRANMRRSRIRVLLASALTVLAAVLAALLYSAKADAPAVYIAEPIYDFGSAKQGSIVKKSFIINNYGLDNVTISAVKVNCLCTKVNAGDFPAIIQPSGIKSLKVEVDTSNQLGRINHYVLATSTDPKRAKLRVLVTGIIVQ